MKEIHQEYTELCRRFTIEEWSRFRGGFSLTVLFVRRTIISDRLYFGFVKFYIYIRLWLIVLVAPIVYIKILFVTCIGPVIYLHANSIFKKAQMLAVLK